MLIMDHTSVSLYQFVFLSYGASKFAWEKNLHIATCLLKSAIFCSWNNKTDQYLPIYVAFGEECKYGLSFALGCNP